MESSRQWRCGLWLPTVAAALTFIGANGCRGLLDSDSESRRPPSVAGSWTVEPSEMHPIPPADTTGAVCVAIDVSVELAPAVQQAGRYVFGGTHASVTMVCSSRTQSARAVLKTADTVVYAAAGDITGMLLWVGSYCVFTCPSQGTHPF